MDAIDIPVEADTEPLAPDGGTSDSTGALATASKSAETANRVKQSILDRAPGRLVFTAGALTGSLVTLFIAILYAQFL